MSTPFLGEVKMFSFNFAPRGWAFCAGQLLPIAQNSALFSLLGTTYGGNGINNFALPNLQGRTPVHFGTLQGGSNYVQGQSGGAENVTLIVSQIPAHTHAVNANSGAANANTPVGNTWAAGFTNAYAATAPNTTMNPASVGAAGSSQAHPNMPPYAVVNFSIALVGIFPSRN